MPYAVNLADLTACEAHPFLAVLIEPVTQNRKLIRNIKHSGCVDDVALVLECDEGRAQAIIDVIRMKLPKRTLRCYHSTTGVKGWKKV